MSHAAHAMTHWVSMCCGQFRVTQSETKLCTSVSAPGNICNSFNWSEKSISFLQEGLAHGFLQSGAEIIFGKEKSCLQLNFSSSIFPSVHHVMSRTHVLPHLPPGVCSSTDFCSRQLSATSNQPERCITMWTPGLVWSSQWKSIKNGGAGMDAQIKSGLNAQTQHSLNVYFMIHSESLLSSEAHLSKQTQCMMTLMCTFSECVSKE